MNLSHTSAGCNLNQSIDSVRLPPPRNPAGSLPRYPRAGRWIWWTKFWLNKLARPPALSRHAELSRFEWRWVFLGCIWLVLAEGGQYVLVSPSNVFRLAAGPIFSKSSSSRSGELNKCRIYRNVSGIWLMILFFAHGGRPLCGALSEIDDVSFSFICCPLSCSQRFR